MNTEFKQNYLNLVSDQVENEYWLQCYLIVTFLLPYIHLKAAFLMNVQKNHLCCEEIIKNKFSPINSAPKISLLPHLTSRNEYFQCSLDLFAFIVTLFLLVFYCSQLASAIKILEMTVFVSVCLVAWGCEMEGRIEKDDHEQVSDLKA